MDSILTGILPVLPTPFAKGGNVDPAAMRRIVSFAVESGVSGVVFPGFASEVETLTPEERTSLLRIVVEAVDGRVSIVAGASAATPEQVIAHGRIAAELGIRNLMIQPPKALAGTGALEFMSEVAKGLPEASIILQNAPAPRGSDLSPDEILDILRAVPQVAYVKEETLPAGPAIQAILADRPAHLKGVIGGGGARYILDEYARGACAAMPAVEIADIHVRMDKAWWSGDQKQARRLYVASLPLLVLQAMYRMRLTKHVLMRRGVVEHIDVRAPTPLLDAAASADIDANILELGIIAAEPALVS